MKTFFLYGAIAVAISLAIAPAVHAQSSCLCINGQKCIEFFDPIIAQLVVECSPYVDCNAQFAGNIPPAGPINSVLTPVSITAQVTIPAFGDVDIVLDARMPPPTTITSNTNLRFPLTVDIRFHADATLQAFSGSLYHSTTEFHYSSNNVNSIDPFQGETFTLVNDVTFQKVAGPITAPSTFTVKAGVSTITLI